ncbi:hypothetical protein LLEC1_01299 [Akanthomyces lecanii]|uniref:Aminoglycoside phosphotransferase domain-containing protein n=1 Tax=Cordyceps confragosa TaxID=2714763 RepID=A0A179IJG9_CORDF|nr:hypothetical protein LLEC1_01299 [Akanthomyces lecanii]
MWESFSRLFSVTIDGSPEKYDQQPVLPWTKYASMMCTDGETTSLPRSDRAKRIFSSSWQRSVAKRVPLSSDQKPAACRRAEMCTAYPAATVPRILRTAQIRVRGRHDAVGSRVLAMSASALSHLLIGVRYLSERTTIPVPKVLACCVDSFAGSDADPLSTFVILEYIEGECLSPANFLQLPTDEKRELYRSLADVYIQLRRLEFPSIGRLTREANGICVGEKTASLEMNTMQLEGLDPISIQCAHHDESGFLRSANKYTRMLLAMGYNAFLKSRNAVVIGHGLEALYNHFLFAKDVQKWMDPDRDEGPFALVHGDLHLSNLIVDSKKRLIGLLDWEWSRVVPVQYFVPPMWLSKRDVAQLANPSSWHIFRTRYFAEFLAILKSREEQMYQDSLLHDEWARQTEHVDPLVASALENWAEIDLFIHQRYFGKDPSSAEAALDAFAAQDPLRSLLADIKEKDRHSYDQDLQLLFLSENKENNHATHLTTTPLPAWRASLQDTSHGAGFAGMAIAASVVIAVVWSRWRPSPIA